MYKDLLIIILLALLFAVLLYRSIKNKSKWLLILCIVGLCGCIFYGLMMVMAMGYKEPPSIQPIDIEPPEIEVDIQTPDITLPKTFYREDENAIGFGLDGVLNKDDD